MKKYKFDNRFVLRDIGGIYFAVDIKDKNIYRNKKMYTFNAMGFQLLKICKRLEIFTILEVVEELMKLIIDDIDRNVIKEDVNQFCEEIYQKGILVL